MFARDIGVIRQYSWNQGQIHSLAEIKYTENFRFLDLSVKRRDWEQTQTLKMMSRFSLFLYHAITKRQ